MRKTKLTTERVLISGGQRRLLTATALSLLLVLIAAASFFVSEVADARVAENDEQEEWYRLTDFPEAKVDGKLPTDLDEFIYEGCGEADIPDLPGSGRIEVEGDGYIFANVEFSTTQARERAFPTGSTSKLKDATPLTVIDRFADIFINHTGCDAAADVLKALKENPEVVAVEVGDEVYAPPPPPARFSKLPSRAIPDEIVRGGFNGRKGRGVIISIVDTGVDFRHPDLIEFDSEGNPTSRLRFLWDPSLSYEPGRGSPAPYRYPNGTPIGTLFTRDQLTAELRSDDQTIPATDDNGHGTACAGIAAGNGNADFRKESGLKRQETIGVAPETDLIAIKVLPDIYLFNAMNEWLNEVAGPQPLVVSNSWGHHYGGHDGETISERQLDVRFPLESKGRSILFAAGNEAEKQFHATVKVDGNRPGKASWFGVGLVTAYFDTGNMKDILFSPEKGTFFELMTVWVNPVTGQVVAEFFAQGRGAVKFRSAAGKPFKADLYFYENANAAFHGETLSKNGMVISPAAMRNSVTVGSYDWNDNFHAVSGRVSVLTTLACKAPLAPMTIGGISCYSSPGPTRDGRMKPEIAAPGQWFSASHAKDNGHPVEPRMADATGDYFLMSGTSAATPYAAGIVALMFEARPTLTLEEVRDLLMRHASKDGFTGVSPGPEWGAGKLDYAAVERIFAELDKSR